MLGRGNARRCFFGDLALASSDDAEVSATIVMRKQGQNIRIYRHLYAP